jgi:hypothetical protein
VALARIKERLFAFAATLPGAEQGGKRVGERVVDA